MSLAAVTVIRKSLMLTMAIMVLGFLHLAQFFPAAEAIVTGDPILLWLRRSSFVIVLGIFGAVMLAGRMS